MFKKKYWPILKKIFFWIFVAHFCWFIIFLFQTSIYEPFIGSFKQKVIIYLLIIGIISLLYYYFLRKFIVVKKIATFLKNGFFIGIFFLFFI